MTSPRRGSAGKKDAWKVKSLRSTFGPQCLARIATAPASGFGSSLRDTASKTYVSPAVDKALGKSRGGNNSPGPIYMQLAAIGPQHLSTLPSAPMPRFGSAKRPDMSIKNSAPGPGAYQIKSIVGAAASTAFDSTKHNMPTVRFGNALRDSQQLLFISKEHDKSSGGRDSPGPSAYNTGSVMGVLAKLSTQASVPAPKIGSMPRFHNPADVQSAAIPGPGHYSTPSAVVESRQPRLPSVGFARAQRDANKKIFISLEHEKDCCGLNSPGPGTAHRIPSVGKQMVSKAKSAPIWSFGSGKRAPLASSDGPGPGEYYA